MHKLLGHALSLQQALLRYALSQGTLQLRHVHGLKARLVASGVVAKCNLGVLNDLVDLNHGTVLLKA